MAKAGGDSFPYSINLLIDMARRLDNEGKKSQWFMIGGNEREVATEVYRSILQHAFFIYWNESVELAKIQRELAN